MTDARLPSRWMADRRFARLAPEHCVSYFWALMYAVESGTDGRLEDADFDAIGRYKQASTEVLITAGLFGRNDDGAIQILDYASTQSSAAEVKAAEDRRIRERVKKRTQRAHRPTPGVTDGQQTPPVIRADRDPPVESWSTATIPIEEESFPIEEESFPIEEPF